MNNPFQNIMGQFQNFMRNPLQGLMQRRLNIPSQISNDPEKIIQHLMDTGQMSQQQYNSLRQQVQQIQKNPQFTQIFF